VSRKTEDAALTYLKELNHPDFEFVAKRPEDSGFDLWMVDKRGGLRRKVELKATDSCYRRRSDIFQKLYFSAKNEVMNFSTGETKVVRVFLGDNPPRVFIFDNSVLESGADFKEEFRAKITGPINYDAIEEVE